MTAPLERPAYVRLREAATTTRERLVVRLAGEVGLRPAEQARIRPRDVVRRQGPGGDHHFLTVRMPDDERSRRAYLPADLAGVISEYAAATETDPDARLIDVTPRRVQMLISDVADRAAETTSDECLDGLASDDLRRYFAHRLLVEEGIDPRVVCAVGGWEGLGALDPYVDPADDAEVAAAFAETDPDRPAGGTPLDGAVGVASLNLDADGRVVDCRGDIEGLLERDPGGLVGTPFDRLFTEDERERARPKELLADAGRADLATADCWFRRANEERTRLSTLVCARREAGQLGGFTAIVRRESTEGDLAAGAFQRAVEAAGQPICLASVSGEIEFTNAAFEELTGYSRGEAVGRTAEDIIGSGENTDAFYAELRETVLEGDAWTGQLTARRKSGERIHVRQTIAPITDESGDVGFVVVVVTDVTDRVSRERSLVRRCETLERNETLVADINAAGRELIDASTRTGIEAAVCESLADTDVYDGAWIGETAPGTAEVRPREWAGLPAGEADSVEVSSTILETAVESNDQRVTGGSMTSAVAGPFDTGAIEDSRAASVVPISYGEMTYGVLVTVTDREAAFGDRERTLLADLGDRIGHAVTAVERRNLLLADTVVELEFDCTDDDAFLVAATRINECSCTLEAIVPVAEGSLLFYVTLSGAPPAPVLDDATAREGVVDGRYIREYDDHSLLEFRVEGSSPVLTLTELGATVAGATVDAGSATIRAEIARESDVRGVVEGVRAAFPETSLAAKHAVDHPAATVTEFQDSLAASLTDKQRAALRATYFSGYFDWPRGSTAEEVADSMGVSSPTLHNHLRKAERKLLAAFFAHTRDYVGRDDAFPAPEGSSGE